MGTVIDMVLFGRKQKEERRRRVNFQELLTQAVDLARFQERVPDGQLYVATKGGEVRWMHRMIADHLMSRHIVRPAAVICLPYVVEMLGRVARGDMSFFEDDPMSELARCEDGHGSYQVTGEHAFLRYSFGNANSRFWSLDGYLDYMSWIGRRAYGEWARSRYQRNGALMVEAFRPLGDAVRAVISPRMHRM